MQALQAVVASLDVAVIVGAVGLGHVHFAHGVTDVVDAISTRGHALVDAVQTFGLLETADFVLWREAPDGCGEAHETMSNGTEASHILVVNSY